MRIIAGALGGRRIDGPPGRGTRPTSDRVREALFSTLGPLDDAVVVDLFAGSGALGLESLSRGAASALFVEKHAAAVRVLRKNVEALGLRERAQIVSGDVQRGPRGELPPIDLLLVDPPYALVARASFVSSLAPWLTPDQLAEDARLVLEHARRDDPPELPEMGAPERSRRYGDTVLSFYRRID